MRTDMNVCVFFPSYLILSPIFSSLPFFFSAPPPRLPSCTLPVDQAEKGWWSDGIFGRMGGRCLAHPDDAVEPNRGPSSFRFYFSPTSCLICIFSKNVGQGWQDERTAKDQSEPSIYPTRMLSLEEGPDTLRKSMTTHWTDARACKWILSLTLTMTHDYVSGALAHDEKASSLSLMAQMSSLVNHVLQKWFLPSIFQKKKKK